MVKPDSVLVKTIARFQLIQNKEGN